MGLRRILAVLTAVVALGGVSSRARADQGQDVAAAETLFREAKDLMKEGRYPEACPKLEASQRLDPSTGTLLNLADCHEHTGKTASAWAEYSTVVTLARRAGQAERENVARDAVSRLGPRLIRLSIVVPAESRVDGLEVERDDSPIVPAMFGAALPIDPGHHRIRAKAPGKQPWTKELDVRDEGATVTVSVPMLEDLAPPGASPARPEPLPEPVKPSAAEPSRPPTWGLLLGGVGLACLAASGALALSARAQWEDAGCSRGHCPNASSQRLADSARSRADFATATFVGGLALVGAGTLWVVTTPRGGERKTALRLSACASPGQATFTMYGRF